MVHAPSHPRATTAKKYVFEHIIVMEQMLGRFIGRDEFVHHRNGIRDDNRPENLELWTKPQPDGIRGADALPWAREIIRRYAGTVVDQRLGGPLLEPGGFEPPC